MSLLNVYYKMMMMMTAIINVICLRLFNGVTDIYSTNSE